MSGDFKIMAKFFKCSALTLMGEAYNIVHFNRKKGTSPISVYYAQSGTEQALSKNKTKQKHPEPTNVEGTSTFV